VISSAGRAPPLQGGGRRFDPVITHHFGSLAQLVEQLTFNQLVAGSNPARPTNVKKRPKGAFLLYAVCKIDFSSQVPCSSADITSYSDED
jgi:transcription elongation factor Elf1